MIFIPRVFFFSFFSLPKISRPSMCVYAYVYMYVYVYACKKCFVDVRKLEIKKK